MFGSHLFACHSEGSTRSGLMFEKKLFPNMVIETTGTEESFVRSLHRSSDFDLECKRVMK
jgi:hypothetical protein